MRPGLRKKTLIRLRRFEFNFMANPIHTPNPIHTRVNAERVFFSHMAVIIKFNQIFMKYAKPIDGNYLVFIRH